MANEILTQTSVQLKQSNNVLIVVGNGADTDSVSAGLGLKQFLSKQGKQVTVFSVTQVSDKLSFLEDKALIKEAKELKKNLIVEVSLKNTELGELSYQKKTESLEIFLTPKQGQFESSDVTINNAAYPFDLIVTLGVSSLEELGDFYGTHSALFFEKPVINIDFKPSNESYATINLVMLTSSSVSEIIFDLLEEYDTNYIDEQIATLLLTGLIGKTNSFQSVKTTPQVFLKASKLISLGAKQQEIITNLYRSKSLGLLRLWGRVLARLKQDRGLVYSVVSTSDIEKSQATSVDLNQIIFEMMEQLNFANTFLFIAETSPQISQVFVASTGPVELSTILNKFNPINLGNNIYRFEVTIPLAETEIQVVQLLSPII